MLFERTQVEKLAKANAVTSVHATLQVVQVVHYLSNKQGVAVLRVAQDGVLAFAETGSYDRQSKLI